MATIKQIEANRLNAQKSSGPRTAEGKASSAQNALKTGIDAQSTIIRGEHIADLETLTAEYFQRFRPQTPEQRHYVDSLIRDDWQLRRLAKADAQIWERAMNRAYQLDKNAPLGHAFEMDDKHFVRLQRRIDSIQRSYKAALHELRLLQAEQQAVDKLIDSACQPDPGGADASVCQPPDLPDPPPQPTENTPNSPRIGFVPSPSPEPSPMAPPVQSRNSEIWTGFQPSKASPSASQPEPLNRAQLAGRTRNVKAPGPITLAL
jgi:hypothetical protein